MAQNRLKMAIFDLFFGGVESRHWFREARWGKLPFDMPIDMQKHWFKLKGYVAETFFPGACLLACLLQLNYSPVRRTFIAVTDIYHHDHCFQHPTQYLTLDTVVRCSWIYAEGRWRLQLFRTPCAEQLKENEALRIELAEREDCIQLLRQELTRLQVAQPPSPPATMSIWRGPSQGFSSVSDFGARHVAHPNGAEMGMNILHESHHPAVVACATQPPSAGLEHECLLKGESKTRHLFWNRTGRQKQSQRQPAATGGPSRPRPHDRGGSSLRGSPPQKRNPARDRGPLQLRGRAPHRVGVNLRKGAGKQVRNARLLPINVG